MTVNDCNDCTVPTVPGIPCTTAPCTTLPITPGTTTPCTTAPGPVMLLAVVSRGQSRVRQASFGLKNRKVVEYLRFIINILLLSND